jgi:hypothetical protein
VTLVESAFCGVLVGGMASERDRPALARWYAEAAGRLADEALTMPEDAWRLTYPVFYLYRHALELGLKNAVTGHRRGHGLRPLIEDLQNRGRVRLPATVVEDLLVLADVDPDGQAFRYTDRSSGEAGSWLPGEYWVPLLELRRVVDLPWTTCFGPICE